MLLFLLDFIWIIFPFLTNGKLFTRFFTFKKKEIKIIWSFCLYLCPLIIYLINHVRSRYVMQYSVYTLLLLALLIDRFVLRLGHSLGRQYLKWGTIIVCALSILTSFGFGKFLSHNLRGLIRYSDSLQETLTAEHGHLGMRAAGFWLRDHIEDPSDIVVIGHRKVEVALFYAHGKDFPTKEFTRIDSDEITLPEAATLVNNPEIDYLLLDSYFIDKMPGLEPLWENPGLAQEYGLTLLHQDDEGLFQIYAGEDDDASLSP